MAYTYERMLKISAKEALSRFLRGEEVYLLYDDNTEGAVEIAEEIARHEADGGEFGTEI